MSKAPALWTKHRKIAHGIAREYFIPGADHEDVHQEALIALWEAARTYERDKGTFPAFARLVIHRHLTDCVRGATREKHSTLTTSERETDIAARPVHQMPDLSQLSLFEQRVVVGVACGLRYDELGPSKRVDNALQGARKKLRSAA